jgi:hypothetical protein
MVADILAAIEAVLLLVLSVFALWRPRRPRKPSAGATAGQSAPGFPGATRASRLRPRTSGDPFWGYAPSPIDVTALLNEAVQITKDAARAAAAIQEAQAEPGPSSQPNPQEHQ